MGQLIRVSLPFLCNKRSQLFKRPKTVVHVLCMQGHDDLWL